MMVRAQKPFTLTNGPFGAMTNNTSVTVHVLLLNIYFFTIISMFSDYESSVLICNFDNWEEGVT